MTCIVEHDHLCQGRNCKSVVVRCDAHRLLERPGQLHQSISVYGAEQYHLAGLIGAKRNGAIKLVKEVGQIGCVCASKGSNLRVHALKKFKSPAMSKGMDAFADDTIV